MPMPASQGAPSWSTRRRYACHRLTDRPPRPRTGTGAWLGDRHLGSLAVAGWSDVFSRCAVLRGTAPTAQTYVDHAQSELVTLDRVSGHEGVPSRVTPEPACRRHRTWCGFRTGHPRGGTPSQVWAGTPDAAW